MSTGSAQTQRESQPPLIRQLGRFVDSAFFQYFILGVILAAAVVVGIETYPGVVKEHGDLLHFLDKLILWIFVAEAVLKMARHGKHFYRYFTDPWNVFDFLIVVVCFMPADTSYAAVLRLARIMRALRLMTAVPQLQLLVGALIKSIPSMGYVGILLALSFYVYAVMGVFLFRENDPFHFRDLQTASLSLFRVVTLEDWTDVMYINMFGSNNYDGYEGLNSSGIAADHTKCPGPVVGAIYFVSFVMFGTMIMLNLFIGVILNSMDEAREDRLRERQQAQRESGQQRPLDSVIDDIEVQMEDMKSSLQNLRLRLESNGENKSS